MFNKYINPDAAAGVGAGVFTTVLLHPLDVIKVQFQVQDGLLHSRKYTSILKAIQDIWLTHGFRGFYRGVVPAVLGSSSSWGFYFYFYENCKKRMTRDANGNLSFWQHMYAAWEGGSITCFFTNPLWLIKTRLQLQEKAGFHGNRNYHGLTDAVKSIIQEEGFRGLYRGLVPALLLTSHGMIQFGVYEELKNKVVIPEGQKSQYLFAFGLISKGFAALGTYPHQVIKARMQQRLQDDSVYRKFWPSVKQVWVREGLTGFYKGFITNMVRVGPQSAITLVAYEKISDFLKNH